MSVLLLPRSRTRRSPPFALSGGAERTVASHGAEPLETARRYLPERRDEPTGVRVSLTVSFSAAELITRAAEHVRTSEVMFIVRATLAPIGRLQRFFRVVHADSPEEARAIKAALDEINLPGQYQYLRRGR